MAKYIIKRLVAGVLSLFILITITFFLMHVIPGGPFSPSEQRNVPEWEVISKYALKNSILPVVTYVGPLVATLLTGTFIIEKLFSIPGLGRYFISAITDRDYSVTLGLTVFLGVMIIGCNLIVDIMYAVIDPRVKITE